MYSLNRFVRTVRLAASIACLAVTNAHTQAPRLDATATALDSWVANTEQHIVSVAQAMPEEKYDFAPSSTVGLFGDVRTFGQQLKHLAANNYAMAARIVGRTPDPDMANETGPDSVRTKTQIITYVRGSFVALHGAAATINGANAAALIRSPSTWQRTRLAFVVDAIAHSFDHYGQLVEYLRMNGIVPPDSRPAGAQLPM
jgi:hypothetical protein